MTFRPQTIIEPFRVEVVEPLPILTRGARVFLLEEAHNDLFALRAENGTIDLMTDSGTGARSQKRRSALS